MAAFNGFPTNALINPATKPTAAANTTPPIIVRQMISHHTRIDRFQVSTGSSIAALPFN
jgi:hypothetical protein